MERRRRLITLKAECEGTQGDEAALMVFVRTFWHVVEPSTPLVEGWVLDMMVEALMAAADGHITHLILNVSPGSMKSLLLNVFFPAWVWGPNNQPSLRFLSASYSSALPERDNDRFKRVINDPIYQRLWGDRVKLTREGQTLVENDRTGWKRATSVGGGTTGHRADFILIDDPNDPNNVESDAVRGGTNHWLKEVMPDRLNNLDTGVIICIQQRTHEQDATGTLAEFGTGYTWISVPMEFDPLRLNRVPLRWDDDGSVIQDWVDPRGVDEDGKFLQGLVRNERGQLDVQMGSPMAQAMGALAWPERFSPDAIEGLKRIKGPYAWAGQYQQSPTVRGGAIIRREWWQTWLDEQYPDLGTVIVSLDTAIKEGEDNDYNAVTVWGAFAGPNDAPQVILIDAWRGRMALAQLITRVAETCFQHRADYLLIEDKARGHDVAAEMAIQYVHASWRTELISVSGGKGSQDKRARLEAISPLFSGDVRKDPITGLDIWTGGMVWAPDKDFADQVISEVTSFPRGAHDDWVDTVSQAFSFMRRNGVVLRKVEHEYNVTEAMRFRRTPTVPYAIGSG